MKQKSTPSEGKSRAARTDSVRIGTTMPSSPHPRMLRCSAPAWVPPPKGRSAGRSSPSASHGEQLAGQSIAPVGHEHIGPKPIESGLEWAAKLPGLLRVRRPRSPGRPPVDGQGHPAIGRAEMRRGVGLDAPAPTAQRPPSPASDASPGSASRPSGVAPGARIDDRDAEGLDPEAAPGQAFHDGATRGGRTVRGIQMVETREVKNSADDCYSVASRLDRT
jgi:hypothetical protein